MKAQMKVLWITNLPLAEAQEYIFHTIQAKEGWLVQLSQRLSRMPDIELAVASRTNGLHQELDFEINNIHHYCFPGNYTGYGSVMEEYWKRIYDTIHPDVVHIHGTECAHSASFVKACPQAKTVVSIQGMASVISRYYFGGIPQKELEKYTTLYNRYKGNTIRRGYQRMVEMGEREKYILSHVKYAMGRTDWDKTHVLNINPDIHYFVGNETMRPLFYENRWDFEKCIPHTIFVTQGGAPYKGFHKMLEALTIVKKTFPDVKLRVALLPNIKKPSSWKARLLEGEYGHYLREKIQEFDLEKNIEVLGALSEQGMVETMLASNIFVSPSAIENSPNSLCEAQLLGIPAIASYVGGTPTIAEDGRAAVLYRYEEVEMLAQIIIRVLRFGADIQLIETAREVALKRHDGEKNAQEMVSVYKRIKSLV